VLQKNSKYFFPYLILSRIKDADFLLVLNPGKHNCQDKFAFCLGVIGGSFSVVYDIISRKIIQTLQLVIAFKAAYL
jgi:hypothetical protein